ncbi:MAG: UbiX family flavin prenyltransferase [Candidatus Thorarchaeota archaeon]|nr:UbiX family flavin prenyltransferase [Candidatus Thorarchaeota archaeon]
MASKRVLVCITGASGAIYGVRLLRSLKRLGHEVHIIVSRWGAVTLAREADTEPAVLTREADAVYDENDLSAGPASGSFRLDSMAIVPCSMKTLASVAHGLADNLISRAADCCLKERRRLVLVPRESPYSIVHLRNMLLASRAGAIILPASPPFWSRPKTVDDLVDGLVDRMLVHLGVTQNTELEWTPEE